LFNIEKRVVTISLTENLVARNKNPEMTNYTPLLLQNQNKIVRNGWSVFVIDNLRHAKTRYYARITNWMLISRECLEPQSSAEPIILNTNQQRDVNPKLWHSQIVGRYENNNWKSRINRAEKIRRLNSVSHAVASKQWLEFNSASQLSFEKACKKGYRRGRLVYNITKWTATRQVDIIVRVTSGLTLKEPSSESCKRCDMPW